MFCNLLQTHKYILKRHVGAGLVFGDYDENIDK